MREPVRDGAAMIAAMAPRLDTRTYVFTTGGTPLTQAIASFAEDEGLSQVLPIAFARMAGHDVSQPMARIVLDVHSALDGCGLTAAVSTALAEAGIACNMIAASHHDHVFVPEAEKERALAILQALQAG